jgi:urease accessory protein
MSTRCFSQEEVELIMIVDRLEGQPAQGQVDDHLILPYDLRQKTRQRVRLKCGREARLSLPRGTVLRNGDLLTSEDGLRLGVVAAPERVSVARIDDALLLARIAYHLGNRHVAVQVMQDRLIYLHDHVLDDMVRGLGASIEVTTGPFEPEEGAYHGTGHSHSH